jgi:acyl phosphate:glycerol-3-phosphate acyltransferase
VTALALAVSYLLGSIPTGLWLGQALRGVDIREHGSRNIGATNTLRVLGRKLGAVALLGDMAKGAVPVLYVARLSDWEHAPLACGLAAILGHTFSVFIRFRGGKGVATSAGAFFALLPVPMLCATGVFIVAVGLTRMVSAGSVLGALTLAVTVWIFPGAATQVVQGTAVAVALLVVVRHRDNIKRILSGTENRLGQPKPPPAQREESNDGNG